MPRRSRRPRDGAHRGSHNKTRMQPHAYVGGPGRDRCAGVGCGLPRSRTDVHGPVGHDAGELVDGRP